jgi:hypothetical protein
MDGSGIVSRLRLLVGSGKVRGGGGGGMEKGADVFKGKFYFV